MLRRVIKTSGNARQAATGLSLPRTGGAPFRFSDHRGNRLALYLYPQGNTPGVEVKQKFPFELLSDADEKVRSAFGVTKDRPLYGRKVRGIERATFVIDEKGRVARKWRGVKVPGHVKEVLNFVKSL